MKQNTLDLFSGAVHGLTNTEWHPTQPAKASRGSARDAYRSDPDLINACIAGNKAAWKELIERYQRLIYSIPRRYGLSAEDSDDVFQNVITVAYRQLPGLRDGTCLSAWLITITHRECQRLCKRSKVHIELSESLLDPATLDTENVQRWEREHILHQALSRLDRRSQELLKALFFDAAHPSYREIAERLGMAEGSVAPTRSRCFKKLGAILVSMGPDLFP